MFAQSKIFWFDLPFFSQVSCTSNVFTGYPPSDKVLREWLLGLGTDRQKVAKQLWCFLTLLLDVTLQQLSAIEDGDTIHNYS